VNRAVFDTNVLASWFAAEVGALRELMARWRLQAFLLVVSDPILVELSKAWNKPYWRARMSPVQIDEALQLLHHLAEVAPMAISIKGVASHPADDLILATAVSANADYLVTGDKPLLAIGYYEGIPILSPREFLTILEQTEE
jgi:putative PIN family toxin of toxin-antitoxin system